MSVVVQKELPKCWVMTNIESICRDSQYGYTTSSSEKGNLKFLRTTDITSGKIDWNKVPFCKKEPDNIEKYLLKNGDIVISRAGSIGYSYLIESPPKSVFASYLIRFNPMINSKFFSYFLQSPFYWKSISEKKIGIAVQNVNATKLKQIIFPLPPLNEQKRIVAKIEELFSLVDSAKDTLEKTLVLLKQYRQSILKHAFEGKLVPQDPNDEPASVLLEKIKKENPEKKFSEVVSEKELPTGWVVINFENVCSLKNGINFSKNEKGKKGIPTVDVLNMYTDTPYTSLEKLYSVNKQNLNPDYFLKNGDLLFVRSSVKREGIAWTTLFKGESNVTTYCGFIIRARLNSTEILPEFLLYYFRSNNIRNILINSSSQVTITNINQQALSRIKIILPPLNEQKRIVAKIEESFSLIEKNEILIDQLLLQYKQMKNSILKQAFEGKLVPQDPNDEPAEVLLQRIREEKNGK